MINKTSRETRNLTREKGKRSDKTKKSSLIFKELEPFLYFESTLIIALTKWEIFGFYA